MNIIYILLDSWQLLLNFFVQNLNFFESSESMCPMTIKSSQVVKHFVDFKRFNKICLQKFSCFYQNFSSLIVHINSLGDAFEMSTGIFRLKLVNKGFDFFLLCYQLIYRFIIHTFDVFCKHNIINFIHQCIIRQHRIEQLHAFIRLNCLKISKVGHSCHHVSSKQLQFFHM